MNAAAFYLLFKAEDGFIDETQELTPVMELCEEKEILFYVSGDPDKIVAKKLNALYLKSYIYPVTLTDEEIPVRWVYGGYDNAELMQEHVLIINKKIVEELSEELWGSYELFYETDTWSIFKADKNMWSGSDGIIR